MNQAQRLKDIEQEIEKLRAEADEIKTKSDHIEVLRSFNIEDVTMWDEGDIIKFELMTDRREKIEAKYLFGAGTGCATFYFRVPLAFLPTEIDYDESEGMPKWSSHILRRALNYDLLSAMPPAICALMQPIYCGYSSTWGDWLVVPSRREIESYPELGDTVYTIGIADRKLAYHSNSKVAEAWLPYNSSKPVEAIMKLRHPNSF